MIRMSLEWLVIANELPVLFVSVERIESCSLMSVSVL